MSDFFGVDPKKVPLFLLRRSTFCQTTWPPHPRPLSRKGRGEKDLDESAGTPGSISRPPALCPRPTFFAPTPKKSPFLAPQKSQKSPLSKPPNVPDLPSGSR